MTHAYPSDELRPMTCSGWNGTLGSPDDNVGFAVQLIDALDTLAAFGFWDDYITACGIAAKVSFDVDINVSVFETSIRVLGGLLSAHTISSNPPPELAAAFAAKGMAYDGALLHRAVDLCDRLLPAFNTPTGIPYGTVNLREGVPLGETEITSVASGGTFTLEFGWLSCARRNASWYRAARRAVRSLHRLRSDVTGLVGNHVNITSGQWSHRDSGVGAGVDSYYEYMPKAYALLGEPEYAQLWRDSLASIRKYLHRPPWFVEANMDTGTTAWLTHNSLASFFPGLLAATGHTSTARRTARAVHGIFRSFGALPEGFGLLSGDAAAGQEGWPLRPEHVESLYHLWTATGDPAALYMVRDVVRAVEPSLRTRCGYASVLDVRARHLANRMDTFLLAETLKYAWLMFHPAHWLNPPAYVFNTEGHPLPVEPACAEWLAAGGADARGARPLAGGPGTDTFADDEGDHDVAELLPLEPGDVRCAAEPFWEAVRVGDLDMELSALE